MALVQSAVADRCVEIRLVAAVRAEESPRVAPDRCVAPVHCVAPDRCVAPVQIVVTLDGVRAVAQKGGDRSVQVDPCVEGDRSVVIPGEVRNVAQGVVIRCEVRCEVRSVVIPGGVRCVARSVVIRNGVQSVARIGFHSLSHRPHALDHSRRQGCSGHEGYSPHEGCSAHEDCPRLLPGPLPFSHHQATTVAPCAQAGHHCAAEGERRHPTAVSQLLARYCSMDS